MNLSVRSMTAVAVASSLLAGCYYNEGLPIENLRGTVVLPEEAGQRTVLIDEEEVTITGTGNIGPVIIGAYAGVSNDVFNYPHPSVGPSFQPGEAGDTYPYGGTTVGDFRFACVEALRCKVVTGRHETFQDIIDYFASIGDPVIDAFGQEITAGAYLRDICFDILEVNTEGELRLTAYKDNNGDGVVDANDLDFVQRSDGKWEGPFTLHQQEYFDDHETGVGFTLWGWLDTPENSAIPFDSCFENDGFNQAEYNSQFFSGRFPRDLLNAPSEYIDFGDYVSSQGFTYETIDDIAELEIDYLVEDL